MQEGQVVVVLADQSLKLNKLIIYEGKSSAGKEAEMATE